MTMVARITKKSVSLMPPERFPFKMAIKFYLLGTALGSFFAGGVFITVGGYPLHVIVHDHPPITLYVCNTVEKEIKSQVIHQSLRRASHETLDITFRSATPTS